MPFTILYPIHLESTEPVFAHNRTPSTTTCCVQHPQDPQTLPTHQPTNQSALPPISVFFHTQHHPTKDPTRNTQTIKTNNLTTCPPPRHHPTTHSSTPTSRATGLPSRREESPLLISTTPSRATLTSSSQATSGAGVLSAGAPRSAWSSGDACSMGERRRWCFHSSDRMC